MPGAGRETFSAICIVWCMSMLAKFDRRLARAARLDREARNCIRIAIGESTDETTAALIDEALKLSGRARELTR